MGSIYCVALTSHRNAGKYNFVHFLYKLMNPKKYFWNTPIFMAVYLKDYYWKDISELKRNYYFINCQKFVHRIFPPLFRADNF